MNETAQIDWCYFFLPATNTWFFLQTTCFLPTGNKRHCFPQNSRKKCNRTMTQDITQQICSVHQGPRTQTPFFISRRPKRLFSGLLTRSDVATHQLLLLLLQSHFSVCYLVHVSQGGLNSCSGISWHNFSSSAEIQSSKEGSLSPQPWI